MHTSEFYVPWGLTVQSTQPAVVKSEAFIVQKEVKKKSFHFTTIVSNNNFPH